jgi:hypothetical protein
MIIQKYVDNEFFDSILVFLSISLFLSLLLKILAFKFILIRYFSNQRFLTKPSPVDLFERDSQSVFSLLYMKALRIGNNALPFKISN